MNKKKHFPGPGDTNVIVEPRDDGIYHNGRRTTLPKNMAGQPKKEQIRDKDALGPGAYKP